VLYNANLVFLHLTPFLLSLPLASSVAMGITDLTSKHAVQATVEENLDIARAEAPKFERVIWYKEPHLRKLYFFSIFLLVGSATTGYDGMLLNTSQQMDYWKEFFPEYVDANKLGILINIYNIGSILSFFITPTLADKFGRKPVIFAGSCLMIIGAFITTFSTGYGSEYSIAIVHCDLAYFDR
jgi:hypothetical protein